MKRSGLIVFAFCCLGGLWAARPEPGHTAQLPPDAPYHIVLVYTDDQRWDTICGPDDLAEMCALPPAGRPMPTVEKLMARAVTFTNAFATNPICCPARATLLSGGFYSHNTNVLSNLLPNGSVFQFSDTTTIATLLQEAGYETTLIGKYLNGYTALVDPTLDEGYVPPGWSHFAVAYHHPDWLNYFDFVLGSSTYDAPGIGSTTTITNTYLVEYERRQAVSFINDHCPDQGCDAPLFIMFGPQAPHSPATPAPQHAGLYPDFVYTGRSWGEPDGDLSDKPAFVQTAAGLWEPSADDEFHRNQLRSLKAVDAALSSIVNTLKQKGELDNTVIIFTSDNGYLWGEHQLTGKSLPYEESIRVPLVIWMPGIPTRQEAKMVADIDLGPTILELAGVEPIGSDGMSLAPLLTDPNASWRNDLMLERFESGTDQRDVAPTWVAIRTADNWKYVEYVTGEKELYDLNADPYEQDSKHEDPAFATMMADLAGRLSAMRVVWQS